MVGAGKARVKATGVRPGASPRQRDIKGDEDGSGTGGGAVEVVAAETSVHGTGGEKERDWRNRVGKGGGRGFWERVFIKNEGRWTKYDKRKRKKERYLVGYFERY